MKKLVKFSLPGYICFLYPYKASDLALYCTSTETMRYWSWAAAILFLVAVSANSHYGLKLLTLENLLK